MSRCKAEIRSPDDSIVTQGEHSTCLYMIAQGDCNVIIEDQKRNKYLKKVLHAQDFFGEISLIYNSARTATVNSKNYSTLASLDIGSYKELLIEFTGLEKTLK